MGSACTTCSFFVPRIWDGFRIHRLMEDVLLFLGLIPCLFFRIYAAYTRSNLLFPKFNWHIQGSVTLCIF